MLELPDTFMRKFDYTVMIIDTHHRLLLIPEYKIWDLRHNSDHFTIMLCLSIEMEKEHWQ